MKHSRFASMAAAAILVTSIGLAGCKSASKSDTSMASSSTDTTTSTTTTQTTAVTSPMDNSQTYGTTSQNNTNWGGDQTATPPTQTPASGPVVESPSSHELDLNTSSTITTTTTSSSNPSMSSSSQSDTTATTSTDTTTTTTTHHRRMHKE